MRRALVLAAAVLLLLPGCAFGRFAPPALSDQQAADKLLISLGQFGNDIVKPAGVSVTWAGDGVWHISGKFRFEAGQPEEDAMWLVDDRTGAVKTADDSAARVGGYAEKYNEAVASMRCPDGFPVKANPDAGTFRTPDHPEYGNTENARVRCYESAQLALADGYMLAAGFD